MQNVEQEIRAFLAENFVFAKDDTFPNDASFLEMGVIDSTGMLELIAFLERTYSIVLEDTELVPENLDSIASTAGFVRRKLGANGHLEIRAISGPEHTAEPGRPAEPQPVGLGEPDRRAPTVSELNY